MFEIGPSFWSFRTSFERSDDRCPVKNVKRAEIKLNEQQKKDTHIVVSTHSPTNSFKRHSTTYFVIGRVWCFQEETSMWIGSHKQ